MRTLLGKIITGLAGAGVALLLIHYFRPHSQTEELIEITIGIIAGLYMSTSADSVRLTRRLAESESKTNALVKLVGLHGAGSTIVKLFLEAGDTYTEPAGFASLYLKVLAAIERSYYTTFVASATEASFGHNDVALAIQQSKILAANADIRRLFICRDDNEVAGLAPIMREQVQRGIKVKYILRAKLRSHQLLHEWTRKVDGLDFAIMDQALILHTDIDPRSYKIKGARLSVNVQRRDALERFYDDMWREAYEPPPDRIVAHADGGSLTTS